MEGRNAGFSMYGWLIPKTALDQGQLSSFCFFRHPIPLSSVSLHAPSAALPSAALPKPLERRDAGAGQCTAPSVHAQVSNKGLQESHATKMNRYPEVFTNVQCVSKWTDGVRDPLKKELKILSFGSSTGAEARSLRSYFPSAIIHGPNSHNPRQNCAIEFGRKVCTQTTTGVRCPHGRFFRV